MRDDADSEDTVVESDSGPAVELEGEESAGRAASAGSSRGCCAWATRETTAQEALR
jgi:hypothetical protein